MIRCRAKNFLIEKQLPIGFLIDLEIIEVAARKESPDPDAGQSEMSENSDGIQKCEAENGERKGVCYTVLMIAALI